jgi:hypothetical protein
METKCKCPYCEKIFKSWKSVRGHTSSCKYNNKEYIITEEYGAIHYSEFLKDKYYIKSMYPKLQGKIKEITRVLKRKGFSPTNFSVIADSDILYRYLREWVNTHGKLPGPRDWYNTSFPKPRQIITKFGSWNTFIEAAGFEPNIQNGFGIDTHGLDGHLYRSRAEAYFADNFLYGKYKYTIEPKYPEPHNKFYDWYIEDLNIYIELDGGLRPQVIQEKIEINKNLNRNLKIIKTENIHLKGFSF